MKHALTTVLGLAGPFVLLLFVSLPQPAHTAESCIGPRDHSIRPKVVGGWGAKLEHWPGQIEFRFRNPDRKESAYLCGGTLIAPSWVLTAAHCFQRDRNSSQDPGSLYFRRDAMGRYYTRMEYWGLDQSPIGFKGKAYLDVLLGVDDLKTITQANAKAIKRIIVHPEYLSVAFGNDITLVELRDPSDLPRARLSMRPGDDPATPPGAMTMVSGVGSQQFGAPPKRYTTSIGELFAAGSDVLREVDLPTVATKDCAMRYQSATIGSGQICAGHVRGAKDSCQGDSGGQLVAFDTNGCPYQIGIVSWGDECAKKRAYGVYTRVSAYATWIKQYVPDVLSVAPEEIIDPESAASRIATANSALIEIERLLGKARGKASVRFRRLNGDGTAAKLDSTSANVKVRLGERYLFDVSSDVDGRLVIVDIDVAGTVTQIFPNKFVRSDTIGHVNRGQTLQIPESNYGFDWFRGVEPLGKNRLLVLVVPDLFAHTYTETEQEWRTKGLIAEKAPPSYLANLIDQINGVLHRRGLDPERGSENWAFEVMEYEIIR